MARPKTQEDVELARISAELERARLICDAVVRSLLILAGVASIAIISWAAVKITEKPAWLEFAIAILGVGGSPSLIAWRLHIRLKRLTAALHSKNADLERGSDEIISGTDAHQ